VLDHLAYAVLGEYLPDENEPRSGSASGAAHG